MKVAPRSKGTLEIVNEAGTALALRRGNPLRGADQTRIVEVDPLADVLAPGELEMLARLKLQQAQLQGQTARLSEPEVASLTERMYAGGALRKDRVLHIVMGPPASGKSSQLVEPLKERYGAIVVDSDQVKPHIPGFERGLGTAVVHDDSFEVAKRVLKRALQNGDNIVSPQTGRLEESMKQLIAEARQHGYRVEVHLADLPPAVAARRAFERGMEPPDQSGNRQIVDPDYALVTVAAHPRRVFRNVVLRDRLADGYSAFFMDVPKGNPPVRIVADTPFVPDFRDR